MRAKAKKMDSNAESLAHDVSMQYLWEIDCSSGLCEEYQLGVGIFVRTSVNTFRPRLNGRHFANYAFKPIFLNENIRISIKISLKFVPEAPIKNIPALVQIMAWRRPGNKPLSEPTMDSFPTHICVTRPQWVKYQTSHKVRELFPWRAISVKFLFYVSIPCTYMCLIVWGIDIHKRKRIFVVTTFESRIVETTISSGQC